MPAGKHVYVVLYNYTAHNHPDVLNWLARYARYDLGWVGFGCGPGAEVGTVAELERSVGLTPRENFEKIQIEFRALDLGSQSLMNFEADFMAARCNRPGAHAHRSTQ